MERDHVSHCVALFPFNSICVSAISATNHTFHAVNCDSQRNDINWRLSNNKWSRINWRNGFYHLYWRYRSCFCYKSVARCSPSRPFASELQIPCTIPGEIVNFPLAYSISFRTQSSLVSRFPHSFRIPRCALSSISILKINYINFSIIKLNCLCLFFSFCIMACQVKLIVRANVCQTGFILNQFTSSYFWLCLCHRETEDLRDSSRDTERAAEFGRKQVSLPLIANAGRPDTPQ